MKYAFRRIILHRKDEGTRIALRMEGKIKAGQPPMGEITIGGPPLAPSQLLEDDL